jgi:ketosteroid isomerase-like protein
VSRSDTHARLARELYAAFGAADASRLVGLIAEDAVWEVPGRSQLAGKHRGRAAVLDYFSRLKTLGNFQATVLDVLGSDAGAAVIARATGASAERHYAGDYCLLLTFREGQVRHAQLFLEDTYAFDALFGA